MRDRLLAVAHFLFCHGLGLLENPFRRGCEIFKYQRRRQGRPFNFLLRGKAAAGANEQRRYAGAARRAHVVYPISDKKRLRQINAQFGATPPQHFGRRFAARALLLRRVRAIVNAVEPSARAFNRALHLRVNFIHRRARHLAAADGGLIGNDDERKIGCREPRERGQRAAFKYKFLPRRDIVRAIDVDDAIAVEKNRALDRLHGRCPKLRIIYRNPQFWMSIRRVWDERWTRQYCWRRLGARLCACAVWAA